MVLKQFRKKIKLAYRDYQSDRIRKRSRNVNVTEEKKMMGGLIIIVNDKMCVGPRDSLDKVTGATRYWEGQFIELEKID